MLQPCWQNDHLPWWKNGFGHVVEQQRDFSGTALTDYAEQTIPTSSAENWSAKNIALSLSNAN